MGGFFLRRSIDETESTFAGFGDDLPRNIGLMGRRGLLRLIKTPASTRRVTAHALSRLLRPHDSRPGGEGANHALPRSHGLQPEVALAEFVEHLQFLRPGQSTQTAALGLLGLDDLLHVGAHGVRNRFSNFTQASSRG